MSTTKVQDKQIGSIGYGLMGLTVTGNIPDDDAIACMEKAYERGATYWNGGEFYGPPQRNSMQLLNKYFAKHPDHADKVIINIKGGNVPGVGGGHVFDGSEKNIRRSVDEVLRLLDGKHKLNMFEAARVDPKTPIEISIRTLAEYVKAGKLGGIALSEVSAESIRRAAKVHKIDTVEVEFSLWETTIFENGVADVCAELGIPITAYSPLGKGFLTGQIKSIDDIPENDFRRHVPRFAPEVFDKNLELVDELKKLADRKGVTPGQVGIAWVIKQGSKPGRPKFIPIPGASKPSRIEENTKHVELSDAEDEEISKILASVQIHGDRYPAGLMKMNFGDSPALEGWKPSE